MQDWPACSPNLSPIENVQCKKDYKHQGLLTNLKCTWVFQKQASVALRHKLSAVRRTGDVRQIQNVSVFPGENNVYHAEHQTLC